jgi:GT2 family glycosyltransferase
MLIKKSIINEIGFMDDNFFVYLEDIDLSRRVKKAGYKSYYFCEAEVFHEGGGLSKQMIAKRFYFSLSSKIYYWNKHFSKPASTSLKFIALIIEPVIRMFHAMLSFNAKNIDQVCKAYIYLYKEMLSGKKTT